MAVSKAQQRATHKYAKNHYDRLEMQVPKGKKKIISNHAIEHDGSINKFLNRAVDEAMERYKNNG